MVETVEYMNTIKFKFNYVGEILVMPKYLLLSLLVFLGCSHSSKDYGNLEIESPKSINEENRAKIRGAIVDQLDDVQWCYERSLKSNASLEGELVVSWEITSVGEAKEVKIKRSNIKDEGLESCVVSRIGSWKFPTVPNSTAVVVSFPFKFRPKK